MGASTGFKDYLLELLAPLGKIEMSRFFGLAGIKVQGQLIGFIDEEKIYFRTDAETKPSYIDEGGEPFSFYKGKELIVTGYITIPDRLLDEPEEMIRWAARAREAALNAPTAVKRRQKAARAAAGKRVARKTVKPKAPAKKAAARAGRKKTSRR